MKEVSFKKTKNSIKVISLCFSSRREVHVIHFEGDIRVKPYCLSNDDIDRRDTFSKIALKCKD